MLVFDIGSRVSRVGWSTDAHPKVVRSPSRCVSLSSFSHPRSAPSSSAFEHLYTDFDRFEEELFSEGARQGLLSSLFPEDHPTSVLMAVPSKPTDTSEQRLWYRMLSKITEVAKC